MKKIKLFIGVALTIFLAMLWSSKDVNAQMVLPDIDGGGSGATISFTNISVADDTVFYSSSFMTYDNYDYIEVRVSSVTKNSVRFYLQEYVNGYWKPAHTDDWDVGSSDKHESAKGLEGRYLWAYDDKGEQCLMFCDQDSTNYANPSDISTSKVSSISSCKDRYAVKSQHTYRLVIYNPYQWNGKTATVNATATTKKMS